MSDLVGLIPLAVIVVLEIAFLWGSIVAFRGRKWWATWTLLLGSGLQLVGTLGFVAGVFLMVTYFSAVTSSGVAGSAAGPLGGVVMTIGAISASLGALVFAAGFVGLCSRSGPTELRAAELEGMLRNLQERAGERP